MTATATATAAAIRGAHGQTSLHLFLPFHTSFSSSSSSSPRFPRPRAHRQNPHSKAFRAGFPTRDRVSWLERFKRVVRCSESGDLVEMVAENEKADRPPFDLNLAVVLAGFAFEAYTSPPKDVGWRDIDAADCQTVFLSEVFLRKMYDGQLFIKLKKGLDFPAMDPWGTSDPYVILQLESQVVKSNIKWATKEPVWNENLTLNIKKSTSKLLQIAAWDANLVTPHKRMGNAGVDLASLCDGNSHELVVELEGLGGGGKIHIEVMYKSFERIDEEKQWWKLPFVSDFLMRSNLSSALKLAVGAENVNVRQFVQFAFGQINSFDFNSFQKFQLSNQIDNEPKFFEKNSNRIADQKQLLDEGMLSQNLAKLEKDDNLKDDNLLEYKPDSINASSLDKDKDKDIESPQSYELFWKALASSINQTIFQKLGISLSETFRWDGIDLLNRVNMLSQRNAEEEYIQSGLATPDWDNGDVGHDNDGGSGSSEASSIAGGLSSLIDIDKVSRDVLSQTENVLGALMVLSAAFSQKGRSMPLMAKSEENRAFSKMENSTSISTNETGGFTCKESELDQPKAEDVKKLFSTAESAMEAWAMLATSLGQTSFIKSDFEKICFLDNDSTDTQVAIWRDSLCRRLVVAFRGTEQVRWKDLRTDLMLVPSGLNPERLGGDFRQELQVHSGFLSAYDSVRNRILALIKHSIEFHEEDDSETFQRWHVYITGHSLGGALATLLALELSSSRMAKGCAKKAVMQEVAIPNNPTKFAAMRIQATTKFSQAPNSCCCTK